LGEQKTIDLFSGAGGFTLGAHLAGFRAVAAIDVDPDLSSQFERNFPGTRRLLLDLATGSPEEVIKQCGVEPGELHGVIGGPPCQGFSSIGKRQKNDPRNRLVGRFFLHTAALEPAFFVMENVPGILEKNIKGLLLRGLEAVSAKYSIIGPIRLNAWHYGAATRRERVIVIGIRNGSGVSLSAGDIEKLEIPATKRPNVFDAIHDLPEPNQTGWEKYARTAETGARGLYARTARKVPKNGMGDDIALKKLRQGFISGFHETSHTNDVLKRFAKTEQGRTEAVSRCPRLDWTKPCTTLRAGTGKDKGKYQSIRPIHPEQNRVITVREAARLQGFPDWFQFHETKWHSFRMIGNSVSP
jgi:DNA (cytosine-5)-methyltransferase 1